jgi:2-keto-4-pentenoate hydratase/2-oxohepta-3-ene-1,7-dioic acid hydratase in catechol pathway
MAINLVRFSMDGSTRWGVASESGIAPLDGGYPTTAALIEHGEADWRRASLKEAVAQFGSIEILPPVTTPCRLYCQGANYRQHMIESGMDPDAKAFNMFFTKSDASVASAREAVAPPAHVRLLDYEVELALVFRRAIASPVKVTRDSLKDFVFAVTIANDLSARDVQLPQMQFFKGAIVGSARSGPG